MKEYFLSQYKTREFLGIFIFCNKANCNADVYYSEKWFEHFGGIIRKNGSHTKGYQDDFKIYFQLLEEGDE